MRWHRGRLDEIAEIFLDVARGNPSMSGLRTAIPMLLCDIGRTDEARAHDLVTTAAATAAEYGCAGRARRADQLLADL